VKDWSDLRIAVAAGGWLANAAAGDLLVIVTDDQAFDAVGDLAATRGILFRRVSYRGLGARTKSPTTDGQSARPARRGRGSRRGGARASSGRGAAASRARPARDAAPHDDVLLVVRELIAATEAGAVGLDAVASALQARGFRRPPGSFRLITRLRQMKELDVSSGGMVRLREEPTA
jgi:hypothetical protein